tara:strand:- start:2646 stop:3122 length:477 start_codon:yes stop_codon:yes gene_type:complete
MDQKKPNTKKYNSISTGQECNAAQFIAEKLCIRRAEKVNKGTLPHKFWNCSNTEEYQTQIRAANKAIKKYGEKAVLHYLNNPSGKRTYSLGFLHRSRKFVLLLDFVKLGLEKSKKITDEESKKEKKITKPIEGSYKPRKRKSKSLMSKIRNIDDKKEG